MCLKTKMVALSLTCTLCFAAAVDRDPTPHIHSAAVPGDSSNNLNPAITGWGSMVQI